MKSLNKIATANDLDRLETKPDDAKNLNKVRNKDTGKVFKAKNRVSLEAWQSMTPENVPKAPGQVKPSSLFSPTAIRGFFPKNLRKFITDEDIDDVKEQINNSSIKDTFRYNFFTWLDIVEPGRPRDRLRGGLVEYAKAVHFVSFRMTGHTTFKAFAYSNPDRFQKYIDAGKTNKYIAATANEYARRKVVVQIIKKSLVPIWISNADFLQEAINVQVELMREAKSEMVRTKAAANLIEHLKRPEAVEIDISVESSASSKIEELVEATNKLAVAQAMAIASGTKTVKQITEMDIEQKEDDMNTVEAEFEVKND